VTIKALTNVVNLLLDVEKDSVTLQAVQSADTKDSSALNAFILEALRMYAALAGAHLLT